MKLHMTRGFRIEFHHSVGNLHIRLSGAFNGMCAWELLKTLKRQPLGAGRVFVDTKGLSNVAPDGVALFRDHVSRKGLPPDWLYFKGEKGFGIAPDNSRVIVCGKPERRGRKPCLLRAVKH